MTSLPAHDLDLALAALGQRLAKELRRIDGDPSPTMLAGGWSRIGSALDAVFRGALVRLCAECGRDVEQEFRRRLRGASRGLEFATAGQAAFVLAELHREVTPVAPVVAMLCDDLVRTDSVLAAVIDVRNAVIHDRVLDPAVIRPTLERAIRLLERVGGS